MKCGLLPTSSYKTTSLEASQHDRLLALPAVGALAIVGLGLDGHDVVAAELLQHRVAPAVVRRVLHQHAVQRRL